MNSDMDSNMDEIPSTLTGILEHNQPFRTKSNELMIHVIKHLKK